MVGFFFFVLFFSFLLKINFWSRRECFYMYYLVAMGLGSAQAWTIFFRLSFTFIVSYKNGRNIEDK